MSGGAAPQDSAGLERLARAIQSAGAKAVLVKGGHIEGALATDVLFDGAAARVFEAPRVATRNTHGTGCTLATAIATGLGQGMDLVPAIERARLFVRLALHDAPGLGQGGGRCKVWACAVVQGAWERRNLFISNSLTPPAWLPQLLRM